MVTEGAVSVQVLEVRGGNASNMIPDRAWALFSDSEGLREELDRLCGPAGAVPEDAAAAREHGPEACGDAAERTGEKRATGGPVQDKAATAGRISWEMEARGIRVTACGTSKHSAAPHGSVNAIHELCLFLENMTALSENDRQLFAKIGKLTREYDGAEVGIAYRDEVSGQTTCAGTVLAMEEGHLSLTLNIRYAITAKDQEDIAALTAYGAANGIRFRLERNSRPGYFPKEHPAVDILTDVYNELTGSDAKSYVMGGGTYARKLPNAFSYGPGGIKESEEDKEARERLFAPGHGGGHEPDEALNLRLFVEAMKIYACAIAALNDVEL